MKTLISTYHITEYDFFHDLISKDGQLIAFWGLPGRYGIPSFPSRVSRQDAVGNPERLEMALGKVLQRTRGQLLPVLPDCPQVHGFLQKKQRRIAWFSLKRLLLGICVCVWKLPLNAHQCLWWRRNRCSLGQSLGCLKLEDQRG